MRSSRQAPTFRKKFLAFTFRITRWNSITKAHSLTKYKTNFGTDRHLNLKAHKTVSLDRFIKFCKWFHWRRFSLKCSERL
jgi:hypothetical protein